MAGSAGRKITVAGAGGELASAMRGNDVDLNGAESAVLFGIGRVVAERVLIADITSDLIADVVHIVDVFWEEGHTAGSRGDIFQGANGFFAVLFVLITKKPDRVNDDIGLLNFANGFFQRVAADVVFAIGNHQQNPLILVAFLQVIDRTDDGVVERGAAAGVDAFEGFLEFGNAAGEILVEIEIVVVIEIDDERLVLLVGSLHQSESGFVDARTLVAHGTAVIDNQAHANGNVFAFEDRKFLFGFIFEDAEIFFLEAVDEFAAIVENSGVEDDQVNVHLDAAALAIVLAGRRRLRIGRVEGIVLGENY